MTAALVDRRVRGCLFFAQFTYLHKKGRESIKGEKSSDGKSINLVDLTFFPLETVLIQLANLGLHENISSRTRHIYIRKVLIVIIRKLALLWLPIF